MHTTSNVSDTTELLQNTTDSMNASCRYQPADNLEPKVILLLIITPTMCFFGLVGNGLSVLVFMRRTMRTPNAVCLLFLALSDSILLVSALLIYSVEILYDYTKNEQLYFMWLTYLRPVYVASHSTQMAGIYLTVLATLERWIQIVRPCKSVDTTRKTSICRMSLMLAYITVVIVCSVLFNAVKYFEPVIIENVGCTGFARWSLVASQLARNPTYALVYSVWLTSLLGLLIPFFMLLFLNTHITCRLATVATSSQIREVTIVMIIVVCVFLFCNILSVILTIVEQVAYSFLMQNPTVYSFAKDTINLLTIFNSSINFFIYVVFGRDFRKELLRTMMFTKTHDFKDFIYYEGEEPSSVDSGVLGDYLPPDDDERSTLNGSLKKQNNSIKTYVMPNCQKEYREGRVRGIFDTLASVTAQLGKRPKRPPQRQNASVSRVNSSSKSNSVDTASQYSISTNNHSITRAFPFDKRRQSSVTQSLAGYDSTIVHNYCHDNKSPTRSRRGGLPSPNRWQAAKTKTKEQHRLEARRKKFHAAVLSQQRPFVSVGPEVDLVSTAFLTTRVGSTEVVNKKFAQTAGRVKSINRLSKLQLSTTDSNASQNSTAVPRTS